VTLELESTDLRFGVQVGTPKNCHRFDMDRNGATMPGMLIFLAESLPTPQGLSRPPLKLLLNPNISL
jgi:hypothetical protein